jgi:hypothetical protein
MRVSLWPSGSLRPLSPRERRVVAMGGALLGAALMATYVVLPLAHRTAKRENVYAAMRERWMRLEALVANEANLRQAVERARQAQATTADRLAPGATPTLAASHLQVLLWRYAEESMVQLDRMDVARQSTPDKPGLLAIPVAIDGQGDVFGLVDFLSRLQDGERLFVIDQMTVHARTTPGEGDQQVLTWSLSAHGLFPSPEKGS